ncbi:MAG TPA: glycoside hydrolase family 16 protein, partial [Pelobium sp.]|nr:glycoside hydrolase family 16 protein [Pelobium sp.]
WRADHVLLNGTDLILKASKFNNNTMYCGSVDSRNKFEPLYGYLEARIDNADIQKAVHTAFWMQGINQGNVDGTGNDGCEVDIFESAFNNGAHTQSTLHWDGYNPAIKKAWTKHWDNVGQFGANIHQGYHIIALEWTPTTLSFYYDGKKRFEYEGVAIPLVKEWLWLSVGASFGDGNFLSRPIGELTAAKVDWIRVYKKK